MPPLPPSPPPPCPHPQPAPRAVNRRGTEPQEPEPHPARSILLRKRRCPMANQDIANREAGPLLEPNQRPASSAKRWAILLGFAALVFLFAFSVNHQGDQPAAPPAATATGPT